LRILVLSDIHSNLDALEASLAVARPYDEVVNLGDVVGYGACPNEVIERSRALGKYFVRGNHDKAASGLMDLKDFNPIAGLAALWTRDQLTPENLEWLRALPQGPIQVAGVPDVQFVHGSPIDEDEYVVTLHDALGPLSGNTALVTFFGHTHLQGAFSFKSTAGDA
jgi:predicted phosphodiesterase